MYVLPSILDLDQHFANTPDTLVFNDLLLHKSPEEIISILCDVSGDKTDTVASCECGETVGNYYEGMKCRTCGTVVETSMFKAIRNDSWLAIPTSIKAVLNPQAFLILSKWLGSINKMPVLNSILDMSLPVQPIQGTPFNTGMGFNWFYDNFEAVITFFAASHPSKSKRESSQVMLEFINRTGKALWCTKLPVLSKVLQPITKASNFVRYADADIKNLMKSIFTLGSVLLAERMMRFSLTHIEKNFFKVYMEFISYVKNIESNKLPRKPDLLRKHVFGSRFHCSGRSVAVPIITPHDGDEIYLPWKIGIMMYKYHILSVLVNRYNMPVFRAFNRIMNAINIYDHEIDLIMQTLIRECPYKGLPILMNRNPSLKIAAIQLLFVTKIKPAFAKNPYPSLVEDKFDSTDDRSMVYPENYDMDQVDNAETVVRAIEDSVVEVSPLIIKGPNLDFDGDEVNLLPIFEMNEVPNFMRMYPAHRIISSEKIAVNGGDVTLSNQQFVILSGWING